MHDESVVPASRMAAAPAARDATCAPAPHLRLVAGGTVPRESALCPLAAGELRRVTGGPAGGPAPGLSPAVEPW